MRLGRACQTIHLNEARFGENIAELLLIPYICMNYTETESRCHLNFVNTVLGIPEPGNGCINSGLGSPVPGIIPEDGGSLDQRGSNSPHKLARVDGSLPSSPLLCKGQEQDPHPTFHGQQSGNSLCQSPRGHAFQGPVLPGPRVLGVVHAEKDHPPCSPHPGQGQCDGRLGVSPQHRLQRLEARPGDFQGDPEATGTILGGPLCELPEHPIGDVLQLEARPSSSSGGCLEPAMVRSPPLHVSTVRSDREMSRVNMQERPHSSDG